MVEINIVYTKTGDDGTTALADGKRLSKDDAHVEALGTIDELNSQIGLTITMLAKQNGFSKLQHQLGRVQNELFNLGSELALQLETDPTDAPCITTNNIKSLELSLDEYNQDLPALTSFVLPGGHEAACHLHNSRTLCRRAERRLVTVNKYSTLRPQAIEYLNRLSDWLFVTARWVQKQCHLAEVLWTPPTAGDQDEKK